MNVNNKYQKMERKALTVFASFASIVYAFALWTSFSSGHSKTGGLLLVGIIITAVLLLWAGKSKT